MRLSISKSKNAISYYVIESFRNEKGNSTSRILFKLGTQAEIKSKYGQHIDTTQWARDYVAKLNASNKKNKPVNVSISLIANTPYQKHEQRSFSAGQLILRKELDKLGLKKLCKDISCKYDFKYDIYQIIEHLVTARILAPCSKIATYDYAKENFFEQPKYQAHDIYRALSVIAKESDTIQEKLFKNSNNDIKRDTSVLFYDCTNFFFEINQEDEIRRYGLSKEHRPNPIVQLGLFTDGNGIPLAFHIFPGNQNEQISLKPLEKHIIKNFELNKAKMIVCTDAGLASIENRKLNTTMKRDFITIQSIKKMSAKEQEWVLSTGRSMHQDPLREDENISKVKTDLLNNNWREAGANKDVYISLADIDEEDPANFDKIFYKEKYIIDPETKFEQRLIVTYSIKYKRYARHKRENDLRRVQKLIDLNNQKKLNVSAKDDIRKYIKIANKAKKDVKYEVDYDEIKKQERFDGFYAVCTSLSKEEKSVEDIININRGRWQIEEGFRLMKTNLKSRPVYVQLKDHIQAHFVICFISLLFFRLFEQKLLKFNKKFITAEEIISSLKKMNLIKLRNHYTGAFKSDANTDLIHEVAGIRFDCELITQSLLNAYLKT